MIGEASLSFVDSSIPGNELSMDGGTVNLTVNWAFTQWSIQIGNAVPPLLAYHIAKRIESLQASLLKLVVPSPVLRIRLP